MSTNTTYTGRWAKHNDNWLVAIDNNQSVPAGEPITVVKRDGTTKQVVSTGVTHSNNWGDLLHEVTSNLPVIDRPELAEGVYVGPDGEYVMVATSDAGHLYGKVWNGERFAYVRGSLRLARNGHAITADEAALFGHTTHRCVFCARKLSRGESTAVGYGPDCAANYGLPWGKEAETAAVARQASTVESWESAGEATDDSNRRSRHSTHLAH